MTAGQQARFWSDRRGLAGVEFALLLPFLMLLFLGTITLFQLYRESRQLDQATSTMSDFVTRQTEVDDAFLTNGVGTRMRALLGADADDFHYQVESVRKEDGRFVVEWAYPRAEGSLLAARPPDRNLPLVAEGDTLILLRTALKRDFLFETLGVGSFTHRSVLAARPRFTQHIAKR